MGLPALAGNREGLAPHNMLENLVLFAALILVAVISGKTNSTTLLGARLFVWARLAYALVYIAGIPWLRTLVWLVSVVGLILIFVQLV